MNTEDIEKVVSGFRPKKKWSRLWANRAAVSLFFRDGAAGGAEVLMIKRAESKSDPWSGQMAFPGGRVDPGDDHAYAAAERETLEEIGLDVTKSARFTGRLSDVQARSRPVHKPLVITPFVYSMIEEPEFVPNYEVAEVVWIPFSLFLDESNRGEIHWNFKGREFDLPCFYFEGRPVWGLSLMMLEELVGLVK